MAREVSSKSIDGIVDLVVWAPVKEGFIHAFENVTYATRAKLVAEALHKVRASLREYEAEAYYSDTTERILSLFDFRIGVVDRDLLARDMANDGAMASARPRQYIYVVATFDAALEPYMRLIWHPLGPFLDLLMCNCEGYVPATESSFADYLEWVRDHQIDSGIFYSTTGLSVRDELYLSKLEKLERGALGRPDDDVARAKMTLDFPEEVSAVRRKAAIVKLGPDLGGAAITRPALEALNVLYKLADYYPPDRLVPETAAEVKARDGDPLDPHPADGRFLLRAARSLLKEWNSKRVVNPVIRQLYKEPLDWFEKSLLHTPQMPVRPDPADDRGQVQGGILTAHGTPEAPVTHGALLLFQLTDLEQARAFLEAFEVQWDNADAAPEGVWRNIGFTYAGLKRLIANDSVLRTFPQEFREGMEARAPMMGDLRENHPRNWTLPDRNWPPRRQGDTVLRPPVELSEVDFVVQLRSPMADAPLESEVKFIDFRQLAARRFIEAQAPALFEMENLQADPVAGDPIHPITEAIAALSTVPGIQLVCIESMLRPQQPGGDGGYPGSSIDHFGFRDGISQPEVDFGIGDDDPRGGLLGPASINADLPVAPVPFRYSNKLRAGEVLLGYRNDRQDYAPQVDVAAPERPRFPGWMVGSSFLVIRKIAQDRAAFDAVVGQDVGLPETLTAEQKREEIAARIVGRYRSGKPLTASGSENFDYAADKQGVACPFAAHIRRANPRDEFHGRRAPRLLRRGMSFIEKKPDLPETRGVMFMAYNASIAEQYETVQRWINGGNSTGVASFQNDPLVGINPKAGEDRIFRFVYRDPAGERVIKVPIPKPLTKLHWGTYLFVPSKDALAYLANSRIAAANVRRRDTQSAAAGDDVIKRIEQLPTPARGLVWKAILEDFETKDPTEKSIGPDVWRAIRNRPDGVYGLPIKVDTPAGLGNRTWRKDAILGADAATQELAERAIESDEPAEAAAATTRVVLVGSADGIEKVLADHEAFSSREQNRRFTATTSSIYVAMDPRSWHSPASNYAQESAATNRILYGSGDADAVAGYAGSFSTGYAVGKAVLDLAKLKTKELFDSVHNPAPLSFKLELRRQYIMPALGELCRAWFDIPDNLGEVGPDGRARSKYVERGAWGWDPPWAQAEAGATGKRMPRCPGDFMAQSRHAFYPRPTGSITGYAFLHGPPLREAVQALVTEYRQRPNDLRGTVSRQMFAAIPDDTVGNDLLSRNLLGIMVGMLPPSDANLRSIVYEWLTEATLWQHQAALHRLTDHARPTWDQANAAFGPALRQGMCKRPAPDLIYRTVMRPAQIGKCPVMPGDQVILGLLSATADDAYRPLPANPDVSPIFGGMRQAAVQADHDPVHACPAYKMAMGSMTGIIAALLDSGRIQAQPASLIVRISDWA